MIDDSVPWKSELWRLVRALTKRQEQKRWPSASFAKLEQELFYAAFAVRKLIDSYKISDEMEQHTIVVREYPPTGKPPDIMNYQKIDKLYNFDVESQSTLGLRALCNQIIHSFVFVPSFDSETLKLSGIFISSDRHKISGLFHIDLDVIVDTLRQVVDDDIVSISLRRKDMSSPLVVTSKSCKYDDSQHPEP